MQKAGKLTYFFGIFLLCILVSGSGRSVYAASSKKITCTNRYDYSYQVLHRVNQERKKKGAEPLVMDKGLLNAAMLRASECTVIFNHYRPNGELCFTICDKIYGENIAYGQSSPAKVMDSSGHKANILNPAYQSIGIGCIQYKGNLYWV